MNYKSIVRAIVEKLGGQVKAAEEIGVSQPTVSAWLTGGPIKGDNLFKLLDAARRMEIVAEEVRVVNLDGGVGKSSTLKEIEIRFGAGGGGIDHTPINRSEGAIIINDDAVRPDPWALPTTFLQSELKVNPKRATVAEVVGDSGYNPSEPHAPGSLFPGDRVIIDMSDVVPSPPGAFALWDGGGLVIKLVEVIYGTDPVKYLLASRNPIYNKYEVLQDEAKIIGRVKGRITSM